HTGFKGGWLTLWLQSWGAQVSGFALQPSTSPSLLELARIGEGIDSHIGDLRDLPALQQVMDQVKPEIVLHLAAQPLVREGYRDPLG
ncbi:GDP-mannose 4,6-dehydratase, partial [Brachybacterium paraconglomeratum]|nr:GDP-mannose 4,6-dehydratase [Brachybacterium paraconglomeratum]